MMRSFVLAAIAAGVVVVGCASKSQSPASPAPPASPPAAVAAPVSTPAPAPAQPAREATPPASTPATPPAATAQQSAATPPQPAATPATADAATAPTGRGGRGRGNPPPPPTPPPAVMPPPVTPTVSMTAPSPDPRVGLAAGRWDAGQAAWNMRLVSTTPPSPQFLGVTNSDLAFTGKYVVQGNYNGFQIFDITDAAKPALVMTYTCPASQSDVSVYKHLLFVSGEGQTGRLDCGIQGVPEPVSKDRLRGIRIFDISNIAAPEVHRERADLPRLAHPHRRHRSERQGERLHLCVRLLARAIGRRVAWLQGRSDRGSEHRALPARGDQGSGRGAREGGHRELAANLLRSGAAAEASGTGARWRGRTEWRRRPVCRRARWRRAGWSSCASHTGHTGHTGHSHTTAASHNGRRSGRWQRWRARWTADGTDSVP